MQHLARLARTVAPFFPALTLALFAACAAAPPPAPTSNEARVTGVAPVAVALPAAPTEEHAAVPISPNDPTWGSRSAPVTIVVFSDFQCPYCGKLAPLLGDVRKAYGPDKVRIVWKNLALAMHPNALPAAEAAIGVFTLRGADAFWRFHDLAFQNQGELSPASYEQWGLAAGVDPTTLQAGLTDHRWRSKVEADHALATRLGVTAAPGTFVNGLFFSGTQSAEKWKEAIDAELVKASALVASGVPSDSVYVVRAETNYAKPKPAKDADGKKEDTTTVFKVPVGTSPVRGKPGALVTIVEFADFQCPYCSKAEPTLAEIREAYPDQVRIVWKDHPLPSHPRAEPAFELAREARAEKGDAAFWDVHDAIFKSQAALEDVNLESIAASAGLDVAKVHRAIDQHTYRAKSAADEDLADDLQATGTPTFFINGRRLIGSQPFAKFKVMIDEEIVHADRLVEAGTTRAAVYDAIIRDGKGAPPLLTNALALPAGVTAPSKGNAGAKIVIQEVADFQCPYCKRAQPVLDEVLATYGSKVRIVWRNKPLPMHPDAALAAEAALEAFAQRGNTGFWKMHDLLYANQAADNPDGLKRSALDAYATQLGLDMQRWNAALDNRTHRSAVEAEVHAVDDAGLSGTPSFVIGGYLINGSQPMAKFRRVIDEVLAHGPATAHAAAVVANAPVAHGGAGGTTLTASGLSITDTVVGSGPVVKAGDRVSVHYTGTLTDGSVFDSSRTRNQPFEFVVGRGQVIKGWEEGLLGMKVGGSRKLRIPPDLGYGSRGAGGTIPPYATLVFDIELMAIQ